MTTQTHPTKQPGWFQRLMRAGYHSNMTRTVAQFRVEAPTQFRALISDLDARLDPDFEAAVARTLTHPEQVDFRPSHVLFPRMQRQFKVRPSAIDARALKDLARQCDHCEQIAHCWRALRAGQTADDCRTFCPNAPELIAWAN